MDLQKVIILIAIAAIIYGTWIVRYENADSLGLTHRNVYTGAVCSMRQECW
jgi:hypothetical protein